MFAAIWSWHKLLNSKFYRDLPKRDQEAMIAGWKLKYPEYAKKMVVVANLTLAAYVIVPLIIIGWALRYFGGY